jgi:hypothetical protein
LTCGAALPVIPGGCDTGFIPWGAWLQANLKRILVQDRDGGRLKNSYYLNSTSNDDNGQKTFGDGL